MAKAGVINRIRVFRGKYVYIERRFFFFNDQSKTLRVNRPNPKSVFECWLSDARLIELKDQTDKIIESEDDVRYYTLCETCRRLTHSKTETELRTNERYYIV